MDQMRAAAISADDKLAELIAGAALITALLCGGGSRGVGDAIVSFVSVPVLFLACRRCVWAAASLQQRSAMALLAAALAWHVLQLIPLPAGWIHVLPMRAEMLTDLRTAGMEPCCLRATMDLWGTVRSLVALMTFGGYFVLFCTLANDSRLRLLKLLVVAGCAMALLGYAQAAAGQNSQLRLYGHHHATGALGTVVVLISILIVWAVARLPRRIALITAIACYALYALLVRSYFALIILAGAVIWIVVHARFGWKLAVGVGSVAVISALPPSAYELLMGPRDRAVDYLLLSSPFGARTAFYNLVAPDSFHGFVVDYAYAFVRLNFAPVFSLGGKEVLMQLFILAALWPAVRALRWSRVSSPMMTGLASLLLGHIAVSVLFEPDLGSYLRHLSSVALFSMVLTASMVATKGLRPGRRCGVWETTHKGLHGSACRSVQHSCRGPRLCWAPSGP